MTDSVPITVSTRFLDLPDNLRPGHLRAAAESPGHIDSTDSLHLTLVHPSNLINGFSTVVILSVE